MTRDEYLREVGFALQDLPWRQRRELVADLRVHLAELPPDTELESRLGTAARYAAELRAAAGIQRRRGVVGYIRSIRPRNLAIFAAGVAVLGVAIGGLVWSSQRNAWINHYQPLGFAFGYRYPPGGKSLLGLDGVQDTFRAGRPFNLGMTVANNGRYAVRVLGVPFGYQDKYDPWNAGLMMSPALADTGGMHGPYVPFQPFRLAPGRVVFLFFKGHYACRARQAAGSQTYNDFPVRYAFRGRTATAKLPLPEPFAIYMPKGCRP
jgi:hypothetical protein